MSIPCDETYLLVPSSRLSVKVQFKNQGHSFRKNGCCGGISVSQTQVVAFKIVGNIERKGDNAA